MDKKEKTHYHDQKPVFSEQGSSRLKEHFRQGATLFLIIVLCIICYFAILRFSIIAAWISNILNILKPIIYGAAIAYLLNPIVKTIEKYFKKYTKRFFKDEKFFRKISRSVGIFGGLIIAVVIVYALMNMLIPELYRSVSTLVLNLPGQINQGIERLNQLSVSNLTTNQMIKSILLQASGALENWVKSDLLRYTNELMSNVTAGVLNLFSEIINFVVGICAAIYLLSNKEQFLGQARKMIYAVLSPKNANITLHILRKSNETFGGFIIGKIIDSAIIGVICFVGVSILKMPYAVLVSVFIGVTNVIPYFGPFIGAIPSVILIALTDPMKGVYFIIFILLLQQLDGNVIGPKILGDSTGLSAFWVLFSILLFGGLFGVVGMIIGVPIFAMIYYVVQLAITQRLEQKNLPVATSLYDDCNYVDNEGNFVAVNEEKEGE